MALISKKTPEQKAIEAGIKEQERETRERQQAQAAAEKVTRERAERREKSGYGRREHLKEDDGPLDHSELGL